MTIYEPANDPGSPITLSEADEAPISPHPFPEPSVLVDGPHLHTVPWSAPWWPLCSGPTVRTCTSSRPERAHDPGEDRGETEEQRGGQMAPAVVADSLTKRFGALVAVDDLSFALEPGRTRASWGRTRPSTCPQDLSPALQWP